MKRVICTLKNPKTAWRSHGELQDASLMLPQTAELPEEMYVLIERQCLIYFKNNLLNSEKLDLSCIVKNSW